MLKRRDAADYNPACRRGDSPSVLLLFSSPLRLDALLQLRSAPVRCAAVALLPQSGGAVRYPAGRMLSHRSLSVKWWRGTSGEGFYETVVGPSRAHRLPQRGPEDSRSSCRGVPGPDAHRACGWRLTLNGVECEMRFSLCAWDHGQILMGPREQTQQDWNRKEAVCGIFY